MTIKRPNVISHPYSKHYNAELAEFINNYWNVHVVDVANDVIVSDNRLHNGVPTRAAFDDSYTHPDIMWVRRYGRNLVVTRRHTGEK